MLARDGLICIDIMAVLDLLPGDWNKKPTLAPVDAFNGWWCGQPLSLGSQAPVSMMKYRIILA